jgi:integrase
VRNIWRLLCKRLQVDDFTTHQLRHTCATELLEAGIGSLVVADHLGQHGLRTLGTYGGVRGNQRRIALQAMDALVRGKIRPDQVRRLSTYGN